VDDTLEVVFEPDLTSSVFEYDRFAPRLGVLSIVVLEVRNPEIRGLSFGVAHDEVVLDLAQDHSSIAGTTTEGTAGDDKFVALRIVPGVTSSSWFWG
jgi:hypothetical protein